MKQHLKSYGIKGAGAGAEVTADQLAKINSYALTPLTVDQVFIRKLLLAHNCIDRDNERFPDVMLDQFAATIPGKSLLIGHGRKETGTGLFFDGATETMSADQFTALTGESPRLPDASTQVKVMWAWFYTLKTPGSEEWLMWIDGGIIRHCSIGFAASDLVAVKKEINGPVAYYEYVAPGEALEGSLVWLGAQPGATAQKALKDQETIITEEPSMKLLIALLAGFGKALAADANEETVSASVKTLLDEKSARISELEADATLGKAFKEKTIADYVALKHKLKEVGDEPEKHAAMKTVAAGLPFAFLQEEVKSLQARVEKAFPTDGQLPGEDGQGQRDGKGAEDNPLVPKAEK